jgi:hypothetical protein|tara:strand:+ start:104 stop:475 length:372 start_codon:yes stop_codon:yes gene_type:complete
MPQGFQKKSKLKKNPTGLKKSKPVRGDQQKLKKGKFILKPKTARASHEFEVNGRISKAVDRRIEETMASRASGDGGGLSVVATPAGSRKGGGGMSHGKTKANFTSTKLATGMKPKKTIAKARR